LRTLFPGVSIHALTATATRRVREDIIDQLQLHAPVVLVGEFDRPNLTYRVIPRQRPFLPQVREVLERHRGEAGIIYCLRRNDVDELTGTLQRLGYRAIGYHAGMMAQERRTAQEQFINKGCDIVVATIAFGMGINRSDIRFVLHTSMPRSIEAYQQETGRAGRDGLEAECVLLNHPQDYVRLKSMLESPRDGRTPNPQYLAEQLRQLADMSRYCRSTRCRHRMLVEYFGQAYDRANCYACDICLGGCEPDPEAKLTSQKVLSAVARLKEHASWANVLTCCVAKPPKPCWRTTTTSYPPLASSAISPPSRIEDWLHQLIARGALAKEGELLILNENSRKILYADESVGLLRPPSKKPLRS
jgi:ATP-dependent DNA helicase RecQ